MSDDRKERFQIHAEDVVFYHKDGRPMSQEELEEKKKKKQSKEPEKRE